MHAAPPDSSARRRRVLFLSADPVGSSMAGAGIRYFELARVIAQHADVVIAHTGPADETLRGHPHRRLPPPCAPSPA